MKIFVNENGEIKDVETTTNNTLNEVVISDEENPFIGWSVAKICCYKVEVKDGIVKIFTPYVPWAVVEQIDRQGQENINLQAQLDYLAMMTDVEM